MHTLTREPEWMTRERLGLRAGESIQEVIRRELESTWVRKPKVEPVKVDLRFRKGFR